MSYLVLARKFRPQAFAEVSGQEHVTRTLGNAIKRGKVAHAYLLCGPRGVGKTSIARIFSKCLNCEKGPTDTPCLACQNCVGVAQGTSLAVREIDGASHNSVDNVRELIDTFRALPAPGSRYKIYIIDEVHMLSTAAFNALLKSLEEPPPHTVFILATTEPHKIPDTVISRCQRHDLRALSSENVEGRLQEIATREGMTVESEVFRMIARLSEGSMRDAQSLLDRVHSFCVGTITATEAGKVLGVVDRSVLFRLSAAVFARQAAEALAELESAFQYGLDPARFLKEFVSHWRELLIAKAAGEKGLVGIGVLAQDRAELLRQIELVSAIDVQDLSTLAREGADSALRSAYPKYVLEAVLVRMATREPVVEIGALLQELKSSSGRGGAPRAESAPSRASEAPPAAPPRSAVTAARVSAPRSAGEQVSASAAASAAPTAGGGALGWEELIKGCRSSGPNLLLEQLKRLSIDLFTPGTLKAHGPDFSVRYLQQPDNRKKLEDLLASTGTRTWVVTLESSNANGGAAPGSVLDEERKGEAQARREKTNDVANHPALKSLQKVFPGSTIENIRLKEE